MTSKRNIYIFPNSHSLSNFLVKRFRETAEETIRLKNRFQIALSGGRTPVEFYSRLSGMNVDNIWQKTHIFQADEKFTDHKDPESNYKVIKDNLLDFIRIPQENVHPIDTAVENAGIAAENYKNTLVEHFEFKRNQLPAFDLVMLGIGDDGHTASLFPESGRMDDPKRVTMPVGLNHLKYDRITLTLPVINNADRVWFLVLGERKSGIIKRILEENVDVPASAVHPAEGELTFLLDAEAARELKSPEHYTHVDDAILISE